MMRWVRELDRADEAAGVGVFFLRIAGDRRGQALVVMALSLMPIIAALGLAIDASQWAVWKRSLRNAADLSALAGAQAKSGGQNVQLAVLAALDHNDQYSYTVETIENAPTSGPGANNDSAVRVVLSTQQALPFSGIFLSSPPKIQIEATAVSTGGTPSCVLGLDTSTATAVTVTGSATLSMNCGMMANSSGSPALKADGQTVNVPSLSAVGNVAAGSSVSSTTVVRSGVAAQVDPYASLPLPNPGALCVGAPAISVKSLTTQTITPGCYSSLKSLGSLILSPGIYYIDGGDVQVGSQSEIVGTGVTIIFTNTTDPTNSGKLAVAGNSYVRLKASTAGTYAGILMYQDPRTIASSKTSFWLTGSSYTDPWGTVQTTYEGAVYAPSSYVKFTGGSGMKTPCVQIVAKQVEFTGNSAITNNCPAGSGAGAFGSGPQMMLIG